MHLNKAPWVGFEAVDRQSHAARVALGTSSKGIGAIIVRLAWSNAVPPRIHCRCTGPARIFPLSFRHKPVLLASLLAKPCDVNFFVMPVLVDNGASIPSP